MQKGYVLLFMITSILSSVSYAHSNDKPLVDQNDLKPIILGRPTGDLEFKTSRDQLLGTNSGISIVNVSGSAITLTGIYIQTLYSVDGLVSTNYNNAFGALWSNVTLGTSSPTNTTQVGANFLYNMIMNYGFQAVTSNQSGTYETPGSATSGTPWLVFLGAIKGTPVTTTSNISETPGTGNDLVYIAQTSFTSYSQQICVACNDATQLCTTTLSPCFNGNTTSSTQQDVPCNLDGSTGCAAGIYPPP